jgi:hypothetical protein
LRRLPEIHLQKSDYEGLLIVLIGVLADQIFKNRAAKKFARK